MESQTLDRHTHAKVSDGASVFEDGGAPPRAPDAGRSSTEGFSTPPEVTPE
ncbi:hypothetical protein [uncultured Enorma sp.]|uniref:hypothetical protein n=1 Tax=uncultured Enorma sp. TaxID=1714346 RepID=UPI0025F0C83B|nr:hypothetical protein [uncultured Enorma sp.]